MSTKDLIRHSLMCLGFHLGSDSKESDLIKVDIWKLISCKTLCQPVHIISMYFSDDLEKFTSTPMVQS